jgi:hypothetical protein
MAEDAEEMDRKPSFTSKIKPVPVSLISSQSAKILVEEPIISILPDQNHSEESHPTAIEDPVPKTINEFRKEALSGQWHLSQNEATILSWRPPQWKLQVFVSSTFTDTYAERNVLLEELLPELRQLAGM